VSAPNRRNQITWDPTPQPERAKRARPARPSCGRCLAGDCDLCVRAGCYCVHEVRKHGVLVPIAGPSHNPGADW
jgi:hypothetical protein